MWDSLRPNWPRGCGRGRGQGHCRDRRRGGAAEGLGVGLEAAGEDGNEQSGKHLGKFSL